MHSLHGLLHESRRARMDGKRERKKERKLRRTSRTLALAVNKLAGCCEIIDSSPPTFPFRPGKKMLHYSKNFFRNRRGEKWAWNWREKERESPFHKFGLVLGITGVELKLSFLFLEQANERVSFAPFNLYPSPHLTLWSEMILEILQILHQNNVEKVFLTSFPLLFLCLTILCFVDRVSFFYKEHLIPSKASGAIELVQLTFALKVVFSNILLLLLLYVHTYIRTYNSYFSACSEKKKGKVECQGFLETSQWGVSWTSVCISSVLLISTVLIYF